MKMEVGTHKKEMKEKSITLTGVSLHFASDAYIK
jgi:hypothetical protein